MINGGLKFERGLENFSKINKRGTIAQYSRVLKTFPFDIENLFLKQCIFMGNKMKTWRTFNPFSLPHFEPFGAVVDICSIDVCKKR